MITDRAARRRPLVELTLVTLALLPLVVAAWASVGPWEALVPLVVAVMLWAKRWVDVRIVVRWKERNDEGG